LSSLFTPTRRQKRKKEKTFALSHLFPKKKERKERREQLEKRGNRQVSSTRSQRGETRLSSLRRKEKAVNLIAFHKVSKARRSGWKKKKKKKKGRLPSNPDKERAAMAAISSRKERGRHSTFSLR